MAKKANNNEKPKAVSILKKLNPSVAEEVVTDFSGKVSGSAFPQQVRRAHEEVLHKYSAWWILYSEVWDQAQAINPVLIEGLPKIERNSPVGYELLNTFGTHLNIMAKRIRRVGSTDNSSLSNLSYKIADLLEVLEQYYLVELVADQFLQ